MVLKRKLETEFSNLDSMESKVGGVALWWAGQAAAAYKSWVNGMVDGFVPWPMLFDCS